MGTEERLCTCSPWLQRLLSADGVLRCGWAAVNCAGWVGRCPSAVIRMPFGGQGHCQGTVPAAVCVSGYAVVPTSIIFLLCWKLVLKHLWMPLGESSTPQAIQKLWFWLGVGNGEILIVHKWCM